ncbi:MAG TPA: MFS transporter [Bacillota bacterium]|nr:MFS transporter [Bacillota bacterium]
MKNYSRRSAYAFFIIMNFAVYGMNGIYYGFIQQYVSAYQTPVAAGYLLAVGPAVTVIAPFFWGWAADRARFKNTVLALAVAGGALTFCLLGVDHSFIYMFALLVAVMFFVSPFGSLIDTVSLEYSNEHDMSFGFMRVTGTVAFGVMTLIISLFYAQSESSMFIGYVLLAAVGVCVTLFAPRVQGHAQNREKYSLRPIFADKKLMGYFFVIGISQFAWMCYLNNEPAYITDTLGLPQWVWGLNVAVTVLGEVPFFFLFKRIFTRFGSKKIFAAAAALTAVRYVALAAASSTPAILATALLTGFSPTVLMYVAASHINENLPAELRASGQNVMYALTFGIPRIIGGIFGGYAYELVGTAWMFVFCAVVCALSAAVYFIRDARRAGA